MKTFALCLILAAPAFAQKPATPAAPPAPQQPAAAPQTPAAQPTTQPSAAAPKTAPTPPPANTSPTQLNPCAAQVPLSLLETMTDVVALREQVIFSRACSANAEANRVLNDLYQALNDIHNKPAEAKKESKK